MYQENEKYKKQRLYELNKIKTFNSYSDDHQSKLNYVIDSSIFQYADEYITIDKPRLTIDDIKRLTGKKTVSIKYTETKKNTPRLMLNPNPTFALNKDGTRRRKRSEQLEYEEMVDRYLKYNQDRDRHTYYGLLYWVSKNPLK